MFVLITGAPGSSKTSNVLHKLKDVTDRPIFHRGIRDLKLPWIELSDEEAREWHKHLPDGAIFVCDEVQDIFPQRPLSKPTPEGCSILSKHRHKGWDVYFITQAPTAVDHEARKYVNEHFHYSRSFGAPIVTEYHKGNGVIDLSDKWALKNDCNKKQKRLPKSVWDLYHSAETHTHQFKLPSRLLIIPVIVAVIIGLSWFFYNWYSHTGELAESQQVEPSSPLPGGGSGEGVPRSSKVSMGTADWGTLMKPEISGLPFTAPIYREEATKPKSIPIVSGCMSFKADYSDCQCYTQQGTRITDMSQQMCVRALRDGVFNHLAENDRDIEQEERAAVNGSPHRARSETSL